MNILVVQRASLVAQVNFSLSVHARIVEAMEWLRDQKKIHYAVCLESDPSILRILQWADAVIFCKHFSNRAIEIAKDAKKQGCITLLDIDDWIFTFPVYSGGASKDTSYKSRLDSMLNSVDIVTVANAQIFSELKQHRDCITLVPNGIYIERYPEPCGRESSPPKIIFTNADFLKIHEFKQDFLRMLQDFTKKNPTVVFDFYGDPFPEIQSLSFMHYTHRIPYSDYINCLATTGYCLAITPLGGCEDPDSFLFNSCKNPFKYINYGIAGIPGIYSKTKIYEDCIEHDITGILTDNTYDGWFDAISSLLDSPETRRRMRNMAYDDILKNYHIKKSANMYLKLLCK